MAYIETEDGWVDLATASSIRQIGTVEPFGVEIPHWNIVDHLGREHYLALPDPRRI
jgi:hypothetical protein